MEIEGEDRGREKSRKGRKISDREIVMERRKEEKRKGEVKDKMKQSNRRKKKKKRMQNVSEAPIDIHQQILFYIYIYKVCWRYGFS